METKDFLDTIKKNREKEYYVMDIRDLKGLKVEDGKLIETNLSNNNERMFMLLKLTLDGENKYYFKSVYTNGEINIANTLTLDCEQLLYNFEIDTIEINSDVSITKTRDKIRLMRDSLVARLENVRPLVNLTVEEKIEVERINRNPNEIIQKINELKEQSTKQLKDTMEVDVKQFVR